ncbi:MAG: glycosyltransferase family 2 protein [Candidatus Methanomethylicia archaeon]
MDSKLALKDLTNITMENNHENICSVIIMVKEPQEETLKSCLKSIDKSMGKKEVIIVTPKPEQIKEMISDFNYIKIVKDEGKGIGIARNIGIASATHEIICFVDPDAIVGPEHFIKIVNEFKKNPQIGILNVEGELSDKIVNSLFNKIQKLELLVWERGRFRKLMERSEPMFAGGTFLSLRKSVWKEAGGFWVWPPYGADDIDFSYRVYRIGWKCGNVKVRGSFHQPRATLKELYKEQYGWGKGYASIMIKYKNDENFWKCMHFSNIPLISSSLWYIVPLLRTILAPIGGFINAIKWRKPSFFFYWIFRRYAFLHGLIVGLNEIKQKYKGR